MFRIYIFYPRQFLVVWLLFPSLALSQQVVTNETRLNFCVDEQALDERRKEFKRDVSLNALKFRSSVIERRAIAIDVSGYSEPIFGRYSLPMTLRSLKARSYLENEKLVIVGDGFDDESLAKTAYQLEIEGFRDVKVLENGRRSLFLSDLGKNVNVSKSKELHFVSASRALSTAAISSYQNEYHFLVWGNEVAQLGNYGISHSVISESDHQNGLEQLEIEIGKLLKVNERVKLVLVLDDSSQINYVRGNGLISSARNLWVIQDGTSALIRAMNNSKITPLKLRNHKFSCRTR